MMRFILLLVLASLCSNVPIAVGASAKQVQLLSNPGFEFGTVRWTASGGTLSKTTTTSEIINENASGSWDASSSGQTLASEDVAIPNKLEGRNCLAQFSYLYGGTTGDVVARVELDDGTALTTDYDLANTNSLVTELEIPFQCPDSDSVRIELEAAVADPDELFLDDFHLGSDIREVEVSQATVIASFSWQDLANCNWSRGATGFDSYSADADCVAFESLGLGGEPDTKIPGIKVTNLPPGDVIVTASIGNANVDSAGICRYAISDGTDVKAITEIEGASNTTRIDNLVARFSYTSTATRTFEIQASTPSGSTNCRIERNNEGESMLTFDVVHYPSDTETAVQKPQTQGWYVDANIGGANPTVSTGAVTSYTEITDSGLDLVLNSGSQNAEIPCITGNASSGLTCSGVNESIGVVYTAPRPGYYQSCFSFSTDSGDNRTTFQVVETSNSSSAVVNEGNVRVTQGTTDNGHTHRVCGYFNHTSAGQKTLRLMYEQPGATSAKSIFADRDTSNGQRDIHVSVYPVTQQFPAAVLYGNYDPTLLSDAAATTAGKYVYEHGGSYNGGNAPTLTIDAGTAGTLSTVDDSDFIPYQMQDGTWRLKFNVRVTLSSAARVIGRLNIADVVFAASSHTISCTPNGASNASLIYGLTVAGTGGISCGHDNVTTTIYMYSGDVPMADKPDWAY